jgi:membrane fusion protein (multidrug efflux system)
VTNSNPEAASDSSAAPAASSTPPSAALPAPSPHVEAPPWRRRRFDVRDPRHWGVLILIAFVLYLCFSFWLYRVTHSITEDAFVEAHIVNITPQVVSGHLVRFLVHENDRVEKDQVLAEMDSVPYRDQVELAGKKVAEAEAELKRQEAALERLRTEVPIQIAIAGRTLAAAKADAGRAKESLKLTEDEVEHGIEEAQALVDAASADLLLAQQEYTRYTNLQSQNVVPLKRAQEVTQAREAAEARKKLASTKLATAQAEKAKIEAARLTLDAAGDASQKAEKGVDLAETGNAQIHEVELLTAVKKVAVEEARAGLKSAEDQLKFTQIRAPFPGVVVKAYRHLGDFASAGVPILSMYDPDLLYVTANVEETRLAGIAPGVPVELHVDAFDKPFHGRVLWINKSTGAEFALLPRNVVSGEFTKVVQRVPVRIAIEKDDRWPLLRAGFSVKAVIDHGAGDQQWADRATKEAAQLEAQYNLAE